MPKVVPKNIADEMTMPYIDDAVDKQLKAADVPPRNKLDISFKDAGRTDDNKDYESNQDAYEKNHGKLYEMTHNNTIPWKNYVVYIVLLSLLTCVFTFSKYTSGATSTGSVVVAPFKVDVIGDAECDITAENPKINFGGYFGGGSKEITLTARNSSGVSVYLTWDAENNTTCETFSLTRKNVDDKDASNVQLYMPPATCDVEGNIIPSTRELTLKLGDSPIGTTASGKLNISFEFTQID